MGEKQVSIAKDSKTKVQFTEHLLQDIEALDYMIREGVIESGIRRIGAEQELCFIDKRYRPAVFINTFLRDESDSHYAAEFLKFNLEINLDPLEFKGDCLCQLEKNLSELLANADQICSENDIKLILTGILPTVKLSDLNEKNLSPGRRFRALLKGFGKIRGKAFEYHIRGIDELTAQTQSGIVEGVNTSFQVHWQLDPQHAVREYNWAQAISGPVLSMATNSPLLLGKRLWHETRIAVFQQSFDLRRHQDMFRQRMPRVSFGNQWVNNSIIEIIKEDLARYRILLTSDKKENPRSLLKAGKYPRLVALKAFNSTVYKWNRLCYDLTNGKPHLRVENRYLPSGPSIKDEIANSAFWLGLMSGLPDGLDIQERLDFDDAQNNFLNAARNGLGAEMVWMDGQRITARNLLLEQLLPLAHQGLARRDVNNEDIKLYLGIIRDRVRTAQTGSRWILDSYAKLSKTKNKERAVVALTAGMYRRQNSGKPVHQWDLPSIKEAGSLINWCYRIDQIMSTDLITVNEDDSIDLAARIMDWRYIGHVPVENEESEIVGLLTPRTLIQYYETKETNGNPGKTVGEIMIPNPATVNPESSTYSAMRLMTKKKIDSLLVTENKKLVGIVTIHDLMRISAGAYRELIKAEQDK